MKKKYVVQVVGVTLAASGVFDLYHDVYLNIMQATGLTAELLLTMFVAFVFCVMAIYGGIQLVRLQEVGRKLAMILFFGFCL